MKNGAKHLQNKPLVSCAMRCTRFELNVLHVVSVLQVDIVEQAGHYPFLDQPLVFLGQVLRQTAAAFPGNAAAAAARAAAAAATPVTAATPQQISEWLDQWCGRECRLQVYLMGLSRPRQLAISDLLYCVPNQRLVNM